MASSRWFHGRWSGFIIMHNNNLHQKKKQVVWNPDSLKLEYAFIKLTHITDYRMWIENAGFLCFSPSDIMVVVNGGGWFSDDCVWVMPLHCCHYLPLLLLSRKVGGRWVIKVVVVVVAQIPSQKRNHDVNFLHHHSFLSIGITSSFLFGLFFYNYRSYKM